MTAFLPFFVFIFLSPAQSFSSERFVPLKIYYTNDIHAHLKPSPGMRGGLAYVASVLKGVREREPNALILDAGDFYKKGGMPSRKSQEEVTAQALALMPFYDARAVGNNELKVGVSRFIEFAQKYEKAPVLSANFVNGKGQAVFPGSVVLQKGELKVGIIGNTYEGTFEDGPPVVSEDDKNGPYTVVSSEKEVAPLVKRLRGSVDLLILLSHDVVRKNQALMKTFPEFDLAVTGHNHYVSPAAKYENERVVVQAGEYGEQIGVITLVYDRLLKKVASVESSFLPVGHGLQTPDPAMSEFIEKAYAQWAPNADKEVAQVTENMNHVDYDSHFEGAVNNWVADNMRLTAKTDVALINNDYVRDEIHKGPLSIDSFYMALPYEDVFFSVEFPKDKFEKLIKDATMRWYSKMGFFLFGFSNMKATIHVSQDSMKSLILELPPIKKNNLTVAIPGFVVSHCTKYFSKEDCPLVTDQKFPEIHQAILENLPPDKKIIPPALDRVSVAR